MNADGTKRCHRCGEDKGPTAFYAAPSRYDGLAGICRQCDNRQRAERRKVRRAEQRKARQGERARNYALRIAAEAERTRIREGWCSNCQNGLHGPDCAAAYFGPDCTCRCGVLGYRAELGLRDLTAPAPMDREIA